MWKILLNYKEVKCFLKIFSQITNELWNDIGEYEIKYNLIKYNSELPRISSRRRISQWGGATDLPATCSENLVFPYGLLSLSQKVYFFYLTFLFYSAFYSP